MRGSLPDGSRDDVLRRRRRRRVVALALATMCVIAVLVLRGLTGTPDDDAADSHAPRIELPDDATPRRPRARAAVVPPAPVAPIVGTAVRITGIVVGPDGAPVAGAVVGCYPADAIRVPNGPRGSLRDVVADVPWARRTTDGDGAFDVPAELHAPTVLVARARGFGMAVGGPFSPVEDLSGVVLRLARDAVISGRVEGPDGAPVAGAVVRAVPPSYRTPASMARGVLVPPDAVATSDAEGRFELSGLIAGPWGVHVDAAGFARATVAAFDAPADDVVVHVVPAGTVTGRVVRADGSPVGGARVRMDLDGGGVLLAADVRMTTTGADGTFSFTRVERSAGRFYADAGADGRAWGLIGPDGRAELVVAPTVPTRFVLLREAPTGPPAAGVALVTRSLTDGRERVVTDTDGAFTLHLTSEWVHVDPAPEERGWFIRSSGVGWEAVRDGQKSGTPIVVVAWPTASVRGIVVDSAGRGVIGAVIRLHTGIVQGSEVIEEDGGVTWMSVDAAGLEDVATVSGPGGTFVLEGLPTGCSQQLTAATGPLPAGASGLVVAGGPGSDAVRIVFGPLGSARGRVVDAAGRPVADAHVALAVNHGGSPSGILGAAGVTTGADGTWTVDALPVGSVRFMHNAAVHDLDVAADAVTTVPDFVVGGTERLRGFVVDEDGRPVRRAFVGTRYVAQPTAESDAPYAGGPNGTTDSAGWFDLRGLAPGPVEVVVTANELLAPPWTTFRLPQSEPARIVLSRGAEIEGVVRDAFGAPVAVVFLILKSGEDGPSWPTSTDRDGRFRIRGLPNGAFTLEAGMQPVLARLEGVVAGTRDLVLAAAPESGVSGTLRDPAGAAIAGARVVLVGAGGRCRVEAVTGADGRFRATGLEGGPFTVRVLDAPGGRVAPAELRGGERDVEIVVTPR